MFTPRKKNKVLVDNAFILEGCVRAVKFNSCTHVLVKKRSPGLLASPGLYTFNGKNIIKSLDTAEQHIVASSALSGSQRDGFTELLTHTETLNEIKEELNKEQQLNEE